MNKRQMKVSAVIGAAALSLALIPALNVHSQSGATTALMIAQIGKTAPDFTLTSPQGKAYPLTKTRNGNKATVLMFVSVQCPVSNAYNDRMNKLAQDYKGQKVQFLGINANATETPEAIARHAKQNKFAFPVLVDVGNVVADRYDAKVTPQVYVIDDKGVLRYRGRIDDKQDGPTTNDLRTALDAVIAGKAVPVEDTRAFGCSIKRMPKDAI